MTCSTLLRKTPEASVGMAQIAVVKDGELARAVLGSCIGLVLYHEQRRIAVVAHIVLPQGQNRPGPPGKFADTAVPEMLLQLADQGLSRIGLHAKLAGGANMFSSNGPLQIGRENYTVVKNILQDLRIPVAGEHVGGKLGRRITFNSTTCELQVEMAGSATLTL